MKTISFLAALLSICVAASVWAEPESPADYQRHRGHVTVLKRTMIGSLTDAEKYRRLTEAMEDDTNADHRRDLLELARLHCGTAQEAFLIKVLRSDTDYTVRSAAATMLGRFGSAATVKPLAEAAASDAITTGKRGCMRGDGSARRQAIFALAEIGRRLPQATKAAAEAIRSLPENNDRRFAGDQLADVRRWALFQLTGDRALLAAEFKKLRSDEAMARTDGVLAFRFLNLKAAPPEIVALAKDASPNVRCSVAMVLGEIGDRKTIPLLIDLAGNDKLDRNSRCSAIASLGRMHATEAKSLMEGLLSDPELKMNAAIALSEITGTRHPLVPKGYRGDDWPRGAER